MHVGLWNSMNSKGVFTGPQRFGSQVVPIVGEDVAAAQELLEKLHTPAPAPAESQPEPKEPMPDATLRALTNLDFKNPQRKMRRDELVAARIEANEQARELIEAELKENYDVLVQQHRAVRERLRLQTKVVEDSGIKLHQEQQEINRLDEVFAKRRAELEAAKEERKFLPRFADDAEVAKANEKIRKAEQQARKAEAHKAEAMQQFNHTVLVEFPPQQKLLSEITTELNHVEALLAGASPDSAERLSFGFLR